MVKHWISTTEYIDIETGEIITAKEAKENYTIIKKYKKYKINGHTGNVQHTRECEPNKQRKLF